MDGQGRLAQQYRSWIAQQQLEGCTLEENDSGGFTLSGDLVQGWVGFYDIDDSCIVELRLDRTLDGEPAFFLHFELEDLDRAKELFGEMAAALYQMSHREVRHVLLCCTVGMTTTYFSMKLNEAAQALGVDYDFTAKSIEVAKQEGSNFAAVLLAPQVGHQRKAVVEALPGTPVLEIPGKIFGAYDATAALRLVMEALSGSRVSSERSELRSVRTYDTTKRVLAVSFVHREDEPTLAYRVLDRGTVALSGLLIRRSFDIRTLEDLASTLKVEGWRMEDFDAIGVAVPSIVDDGVVIEERDGEELRFELRERLEQMWNNTVYLDFSATAAAVGCYVSQDAYENVVFHAQAVGRVEAEEGYVVSGVPVIGRHGRSGHLGNVARGFALSMPVEDAAWRVTGMRELVARHVETLACTIAPDVVYVWCDLLPDMDELRDELLKTLHADAVPELVAISDYDEHVLLGELSLCLRRIAKA